MMGRLSGLARRGGPRPRRRAARAVRPDGCRARERVEHLLRRHAPTARPRDQPGRRRRRWSSSTSRRPASTPAAGRSCGASSATLADGGHDGLPHDAVPRGGRPARRPHRRARRRPHRRRGHRRRAQGARSAASVVDLRDADGGLLRRAARPTARVARTARRHRPARPTAPALGADGAQVVASVARASTTCSSRSPPAPRHPPPNSSASK